jgi:hypothetical protein
MVDHNGSEYERELAAFQEMLDTAEVAGLPRRAAELVELQRLVRRYPDQARAVLDEVEKQ